MNDSIRIAAPLLAVLLSASAVRAQEMVIATPARQAIYVEAGGPVGVASINYDRILSDTWAVRVGLEVDGSGKHFGDWYPEIPATVSYVAFSGDHHAEFGGGVVLTAGSASNDGIYQTMHAGYRYQPGGSGLFFRATLTRSERYRLPHLPFWGGIGVGYTFER
jgi:hypothetical protein